MLTKIFPTYIWINNLNIDVDYINNYVDENAVWDLIYTKNNRDPNTPKTDQYGRLWDDVDLSQPFFKALQEEIKIYYKEINSTYQGHLIASWVHDYNETQSIDWHNHRATETVAVLYLKNYNEGGNIEFLDPKEYAMLNEPAHSLRSEEYYSYSPKVGDIIFFPGYLKHRSLPGKGGNRRVLGFHFKGV